MKTYRLTREEQLDFDPQQFTARLKAAGFRFDSDTCPIKISQPWSRTLQDDGTWLYQQEELQ